MPTLLHSLSQRFGSTQIQTIQRNNDSYYLITLPGSKELRILMTTGLSDFQMKVHEKHVGEEWKELYVLIPSYWDLTDEANVNMNWVFDWLTKLKNYVISNDTWLGHGHTLPTGKEMHPISPTMKQNHFMIFLAFPPTQAWMILKKRIAGCHLFIILIKIIHPTQPRCSKK